MALGCDVFRSLAAFLEKRLKLLFYSIFSMAFLMGLDCFFDSVFKKTILAV